MPGLNAYVTTNANFRLTADSRVYVMPLDDADAPLVPERSPVGGVLFWHRVNEALATVGWRVDGHTSHREEDVTALDLPYTHVIHFRAAPKGS
ncbi:hypothetical protein Drose_05555 [Dactylosporangium roseum]|uniref:Uncharacterized protein n=1 Tax=Dactylosporangium roseum TaxID=47989 RepID=A0ABY5Z6Q6_9ACTN|nr:hypothetical protein [Dactylosporangium roseum]UWZ37735.1 hypothetical protein Drose_05555 [Dactylosporangium roseum]